jgi:hypothetical protein
MVFSALLTNQLRIIRHSSSFQYEHGRSIRHNLKMTAPTVTIEEGQVKGKTAENYLGGIYYSFLGIPYAKAPVGELRFKVSFDCCKILSW